MLQTCPGLEQYAIKKFAEAFEVVPRALSENSGVKATEVISKLYAAHHEGNRNMGVDIEVSSPNKSLAILLLVTFLCLQCSKCFVLAVL